MTPLSRDALARMVALHLPQEGFVNLGIGAPTHVADYIGATSGSFRCSTSEMCLAA